MEPKKHKTRVSIPSLIPSNPTSLPPSLHFLFFIIVIITTAINTATTTASVVLFSQSYSKHCDQIVPASNPTTLSTDYTTRSFTLGPGFFSSVAAKSHDNTTNTNGNNVAGFYADKVAETENSDVLYLESVLRLTVLNSSSVFKNPGRRLLKNSFRYRGFRDKGIMYKLEGFWSLSSGKLCMVGSSSLNSGQGTVIHNVVFKLNYPNATTIVTSLVNGVLESLDSRNDSLRYFEPKHIWGVSNRNYEYTLIEKESSEKFGDDNRSVGLAQIRDVCTTDLGLMDKFELDYSNVECDDPASCNPLGRGFDVLPKFMFLGKVQCSKNERVHFLMWFSDLGYNHYRRPFRNETILVAEGLWDKYELRVVACPISYSSSLAKASVGDCSFKLSLRFSSSLSLKKMRVLEGQVWNNRSESENGRDHLARVGFSRSVVFLMDTKGLAYEYTEIDNVKNICAKKTRNKHKGSIYPDENSSDLKVGMTVKNSMGQDTNGYITPLFVNNFFYRPYSRNRNIKNLKVPLNVSYYVTVSPQSGFKFGQEKLLEQEVEIFAEGVYDRQTGFLCMKGCRHLDSNQRNFTESGSLDCEILVNVQYRSLTSNGQDTIKGAIESTRSNSDPLYFGRLELSSRLIYQTQAAQSVSRMDMEIVMVLLSTTIACVFVGLQLYHVKKHANVLPFISVVMLTLLTLGHMIPLLLNFEALLSTNPNHGNLYFDDDGWIEKNQVIVRVVTMIAFLLQARLLQQTWSSKSGDDESRKKLWISEKKVAFVTLPLYIFGGAVTYFVYKWFHGTPFPQPKFLHPRGRLLPFKRRQNHLWVKSYGGLIMDSFLLPQILFNLFFNSKEKALAPSFYIGTTAVRLLPHAYDLYRSHSSNWVFGVSHIYASPASDLYSTAWDLIIPGMGLLFAGIVYLQQRFGGRFLLPKRYQENSEYEKVPVTNDVPVPMPNSG